MDAKRPHGHHRLDRRWGPVRLVCLPGVPLARLRQREQNVGNPRHAHTPRLGRPDVRSRRRSRKLSHDVSRHAGRRQRRPRWSDLSTGDEFHRLSDAARRLQRPGEHRHGRRHGRLRRGTTHRGRQCPADGDDDGQRARLHRECRRHGDRSRPDAERCRQRRSHRRLGDDHGQLRQWPGCARIHRPARDQRQLESRRRNVDVDGDSVGGELRGGPPRRHLRQHERSAEHAGSHRGVRGRRRHGQQHRRNAQHRHHRRRRPPGDRKQRRRRDRLGQDCREHHRCHSGDVDRPGRWRTRLQHRPGGRRWRRGRGEVLDRCRHGCSGLPHPTRLRPPR